MRHCDTAAQSVQEWWLRFGDLDPGIRQERTALMPVSWTRARKVNVVDRTGGGDLRTAELMDIIFMNEVERKMYEHEGLATDAWIKSSKHDVTVVATLGDAFVQWEKARAY
jgi:hypothetical protein